MVVSVTKSQNIEYKGKYKLICETQNGKIHGKCVAYYVNGNKIAEGVIENGYKNGIWTLWDSIGNIVVQRQYENPFVYKVLTPKKSDNSLIQLLDVYPYQLKLNKDGYFDLFSIRERDIVWSKRLWRFVNVEDNKYFQQHNFFKIIEDNAINRKITVYDASNEDFSKALCLAKPLDKEKYNLIGYNVKEDVFFDNIRFVMEYRIIGFCPVAVHKTNGDTLNLYWVHYPTTRKFLSQEKIDSKHSNSLIKTYDDILFFRDFTGSIYKESNAWDKPISAYTKVEDISKEAMKIELSILEKEIECWFDFFYLGELK